MLTITAKESLTGNFAVDKQNNQISCNVSYETYKIKLSKSHVNLQGGRLEYLQFVWYVCGYVHIYLCLLKLCHPSNAIKLV